MCPKGSGSVTQNFLYLYIPTRREPLQKETKISLLPNKFFPKRKNYSSPEIFLHAGHTHYVTVLTGVLNLNFYREKFGFTKPSFPLGNLRPPEIPAHNGTSPIAKKFPSLHERVHQKRRMVGLLKELDKRCSICSDSFVRYFFKKVRIANLPAPFL